MAKEPYKVSGDKLFKALSSANPQAVKEALESGADVNMENSSGEPALFFFIIEARNNESFSMESINGVLATLAEAGANLNGQHPKTKESPLMAACVSGRGNGGRMIKALLCLGADPNQCDSWGKTPLMSAVAYSTVTCCSRLLMAGADPNYANSEGMTALHFAAKQASPTMAGMLLNMGADPMAETVTGHVPADFVADLGHHHKMEANELSKMLGAAMLENLSGPRFSSRRKPQEGGPNDVVMENTNYRRGLK